MGDRSAHKGETTLRLGVFMMPLHPPGRPMHDYLAEDTEKAVLLDKLGYDELWVGEHFTAGTEPYPSPLMFMASLLPRTERLKFATGVISAPNRHPAHVAAEAAQFDHMSRGRFILGIGTGSLATDAELFGVNADAAQKARMLIEHIDMVERIWAQDAPYDLKGEFWNIKLKDTLFLDVGFGVMPKPFQRPRPPICIPSATPNSKSTYLCGQRGWGPVSSALLSGDALVQHWHNYQQGCLDARREIDPANWRVVRSVLVAATDEEARARALHPDSAQRGYFTHFFKILGRSKLLGALRPRPSMTDSEITVDGIIESRLIYGSPQTVAAELARLREQAGPFGTLLVSGMHWTEPNADWERESLTRLAKEVIPLLSDQITTAKAPQPYQATP
jgi:alkanesulfonate monooxygenase SsuD/methylene tetrahydromethanopterin reductase-like flavin-dependent oxidoreductase (luciferase family)